MKTYTTSFFFGLAIFLIVLAMFSPVYFQSRPEHDKLVKFYHFSDLEPINVEALRKQELDHVLKNLKASQLLGGASSGFAGGGDLLVEANKIVHHRYPDGEYATHPGFRATWTGDMQPPDVANADIVYRDVWVGSERVWIFRKVAQ